MKLGREHAEPYLERLRELPFVIGIQLKPHGSRGTEETPWHLVIETPTARVNLAYQVKHTHLTQELAEDIARNARKSPGLLVFVPSVGRDLGEFFQREGVNFVDRAGNCHVRLGDQYLARVQGRRPLTVPVADKALRAPSYRVLFAMLADDSLLAAPTRTVALRAGGVSPQTVSDLRERLAGLGILLPVRKRYRWGHQGRRHALDLWLAGFAATLSPSLSLGRYRARERDPEAFEARVRPALDKAGPWRWGGAAAAMRLTQYYRGDRTVVYLAEPRASIARDLQLVPDQGGPIILMRSPGPLAFEGPHPECVHPLLVYADLLAEAHERAREAAGVLFEKYLDGGTGGVRSEDLVPVTNIIGGVVEGDDFFDRADELRVLREEGLQQNLLLLAPRRVGKTSLLHRLAAVTTRQAGRHAIYLSVEGAADEGDFVRMLVDALKQDPAAKPCVDALEKSQVGRFLRSSREVTPRSPKGTRAKSKSSFSEALWRDLRAALKRLPDHWFLLIDEVPLFVVALLRQDPTGARARHFLQRLRALRVRDVDSTTSLHWVFAGSIGFDTITERHGLTDTINDLRVVTLGALSAESARAFLRALAARYAMELDAAVLEAVCERVGWLIPYHLQLLFSELRTRRGSSQRALTPNDVTASFHRLVEHSAYFSGWRERLPRELGETRAVRAGMILDATAQDPRGATRAALSQVLARSMIDAEERERELRWLLRFLVRDGYLREDGERCPFRSNLLREWWVWR